MLEEVEQQQDESVNKKLMLRTFDYVDFGGDMMDNDEQLYDTFSNNDFDEVDEDSDDVYDGEGSDELEDALEYALQLNLPSLEGAIDRVGSSGSLISWLENKMKNMSDEEMKEYEKLTGEIDLVQGALKEGLKKVFSSLTENLVIVSDSSVSFCKELLEKFALIAIETAYQISCLRETKIVTSADMMEAMKMLGRSVYYDNEKEEDDVIVTIFDIKVIQTIVDFVKKEVELEKDVYHVIQHSFEDFLYSIMCNAMTLQRTYRDSEPISVNDMMMVLHMWNQSPCNNGSGYLIQKIICK